jgi:hypothetical protein
MTVPLQAFFPDEGVQRVSGGEYELLQDFPEEVIRVYRISYIPEDMYDCIGCSPFDFRVLAS